MIPLLRVEQEVESRGSDAVEVAERLLALALDTVREVWWRLQGLPPEQLLMLAALGIAVLLFRSFRCLLLIVLAGLVALVVFTQGSAAFLWSSWD